MSAESSLLLGRFALQAAPPFRGPDARGQRGLGVAAGQPFDADHVVAADRFDYFAECSHAR